METVSEVLLFLFVYGWEYGPPAIATIVAIGAWRWRRRVERKIDKLQEQSRGGWSLRLERKIDLLLARAVARRRKPNSS